MVLTDQYQPSVGWGDQSFLVTWSEDQIFSSADPDGLARGARLDRFGSALDPAGFSVPFRGNTIWDGTDFVVMAAHWPFSYGSQIRAARISSDGTVLDPTPVNVPDRWAASDGNRIVFIGSSQRTFFDTALQGAGSESTALTPPCTPVDGVWNGSSYVAACTQQTASGYTLYLDLFAPDGRPAGVAQIGDVAASLTAKVAGGGSRNLIVWNPSAGELRSEIRDDNLLRIGAQAVLSPSGKLLGAAWDGTHFVVLWQVGRELLAARIASDGTVLDPGGFTVALNINDGASLASTGDGTTVFVYTEHDDDLPAGPYAPIRVKARYLWPDGVPADGGLPIGPTDGSVAYVDAPFVPPTIFPGTGGSGSGSGGSSSMDSGAAGGSSGGADAGKRDAASSDATSGSGGTNPMDGSVAAGGSPADAGGGATGGGANGGTGGSTTTGSGGSGGAAGGTGGGGGAPSGSGASAGATGGTGGSGGAPSGSGGTAIASGGAGASSGGSGAGGVPIASNGGTGGAGTGGFGTGPVTTTGGARSAGGSTRDASAGAAVPNAEVEGSGCGCVLAATGRDDSAPSSLVIALVSLALARRRRSAARR
jgi:hypothetical protein